MLNPANAYPDSQFEKDMLILGRCFCRIGYFISFNKR